MFTAEKRDNKPHFHVAAGVIWRHGRVLIAKRPHGSHLEGFWEFPGGTQERGESLKGCLEREIEEELGIRVTADKAIFAVTHEYESKLITLHVFDCSHMRGDPKAFQHQEIRWVDPTDLPKYAFPPPDLKVIEHLSGSGSGLREGGHMFYKRDDTGYKEIAEGVRLKALVHGKRTLLTEFRLTKGEMVPRHSHPHEQTGYLVSGNIDLIIDGERFEAGPGDSWCIPGDVEHAGEVLEDSVAIEVFSPVREDYLP